MSTVNISYNMQLQKGLVFLARFLKKVSISTSRALDILWASLKTPA